MSKDFILLGDKITHGDYVISASSTMVVNGKKVALVGDQVNCPVMESHDNSGQRAGTDLRWVYIKLSDGNIELGAPQNILLKATNMQKMGRRVSINRYRNCQQHTVGNLPQCQIQAPQWLCKITL